MIAHDIMPMQLLNKWHGDMLCVLCALLLTTTAFVYIMIICLHMSSCLRTWRPNIVVACCYVCGYDVRYPCLLYGMFTWVVLLPFRLVTFLTFICMLCSHRFPMHLFCNGLLSIPSLQNLSSPVPSYTYHDSPTTLYLSLCMSMTILLLHDNCCIVRCAPW